ncbi:hypothetical protein RUM44_005347 [Polyplax serrata]|uniref:Mitochondrial 2-oxoglutarate/malate carrier protein n=1 Tax=Polyplax serrata TaxID=468196 RepID=A0ABR1ADB1_POLSC
MAQDATKSMPKYVKFAFGGLSGMAATFFVQPLDLVKNRMQLSGADGKAKEYRTSFHAFSSILKNEGIVAMYSGLSAGLLRQATYTTTRLGVYTWLFENYTGLFNLATKEPNIPEYSVVTMPKVVTIFPGTNGKHTCIFLLHSKDGIPPGFFVKAGLGMAAGCTGAFVGTPAEVALIRMTADGRLPLEERRNYKNVFEALLRISKEEGILTLWRGAVPTMGRAMVVNAAQLASYSQAKQYLLTTGYFEDNVFCHFVSSMISGFVTTAASMPVDIAKTRIQNMKTINGNPEYKGAGDVLIKVIRNEGVFALWKGFTPYYARLGPHTVLTFIFLEQMNKYYKAFVLGETNVKSSL